VFFLSMNSIARKTCSPLNSLQIKEELFLEIIQVSVFFMFKLIFKQIFCELRNFVGPIP